MTASGGGSGWLPLALLAALGSASTNLALKRAVAHGGVIISSVVFRGLAGVLLLALVLARGPWPAMPYEYWRTVAMCIPAEAAGLFCMALALRDDDLSRIQPIFGFIPLLVMAGGAVVLRERPSAVGFLGILLVTVGVYATGLRPGGSFIEPLRALTKVRASWYALAACVFFSVTTVLHKIGIRIVGPLPWGTTLAFGSSLSLLVLMPVLAWRAGGLGLPKYGARWAAWISLGAVAFAFQQFGLQLSLRLTQASYVIAVSSMSTLIAAALGVGLLRERAAGRTRIAGAALVAGGAALIALTG